MNSTAEVDLLVMEAEDALGLLARIAEVHLVVSDVDGTALCERGEPAEEYAVRTSLPLRIEAEPVATITVCGARARDTAELAAGILYAVYRRKLVVGVYRETLSDSYEELLERNRKLADLAASLEEKVRIRTRELDETHAKLAREEKIAAIGRLAAGVAHELNTPLACVRSNLSTLRDALPHGDEPAQIMQESLDMLDRAAGIVRDLRGFSHVDDYGKVYVNLNTELDAILGRLELPANVAVVRDYGKLPEVPVDGRQLTVALLHLVENARDAVAGGGQIRVATVLRGDRVAVCIADTGAGILPETMRHVFDPFFTTKDVGRGTGLGLTVARNIIRAHGGDLTLECPAVGGTAARIELPAAAADGA